MCDANDLKPALPKTGQLIVEDIEELVLCKPRLIPLKSFTLEKLERMQQQAQKLADEQKQASNVEEED